MKSEMRGTMELIGLVAAISQLASQILRLAMTAERNRENCKQLSERVSMINELMEVLHSQWTPEPMTKRMLGNLKVALNDGVTLVECCQKKRTWSRVFKAHKEASYFDDLDKRISQILEQFHIANMILLVSVNKDRFFMDVLEKLLDDGACRRLPQNKKEELKSSIMSLSNTDNMSSETKRILELLKSELAHGGLSATVTLPRGHGGSEEAWTDGDTLTTEIINLDTYIVKKAWELRDDRDEMQQLVKLVQLVGDHMKDAQYSQALRDPTTRTLVGRLKDDLQEVSGAIEWYSRKRNTIKRTILCGPDDATSEDYGYIRKLAYKIEYYVQVLPVITIRQMYERNA